MSFSDWEFQRAYSYVDLLAPEIGWPVENSSLSNPLGGSGTYCRSFEGSTTSGGASDNGGVVYRLKLTNPDYVDVPNDQAISLRAKIRIKSFTFSLGTENFGRTYQQYIGVGSYFSDLISGNQYASHSPLGYGMGLQAYFQNNGSLNPGVRLIMLADSSTGNQDLGVTAANNYALVTVCSGTYTLDTWYDIRFDIIPNSTTSVFLRGYTSADGGSTWSQVGEYYIDQTVNTRFRTLGNNGIIARIVTSRAGDRPAWDNINAKVYVDDFKINTELAL